MDPLVLTGKLSSVESEDGGCARIAYLQEDHEPDEGFFLRFQSWVDNPRPESHAILKALEGRRLRVTIEVLD
jgi:ribonuclease HI